MAYQVKMYPGKRERLRVRKELFTQFLYMLEHENIQAAGWMGYLVLEIQTRIPDLGPHGALELACAILLHAGHTQPQGES